jgi:antitoxin (DNA-binding transcriptional repressor) of toxin-antitoxin stability system
MRLVSIEEAMATFDELLCAAEAGEAIRITRNGRVVAKMVAESRFLSDHPTKADESAI